MDRDKNWDTEAGGAGIRTERGAAKRWSIFALGTGALWNAWNVVGLAARDDSPAIPFVSAVLMTAVAVVAWRRWPG
ncbi:hypothetical protein J2X06_000496 [Lysobacter niastensis]|uniref:EamA family transporter n=1 Tax=Lysobacter niastensis TaxID=380629 RepID=A0ABU1W738_9GAMM|nr:hypothetical protein [Lysobacter niastensis]MDR7133312.1 hypothetical protein [Lysobacter niastensis]